MDMEIVTFVTDSFKIDLSSFTIVGLQHVQHDVVLNQIVGVTDLEETIVPLDDLQVAVKELKWLHEKGSRALKGWKFTVYTEQSKDVFTYFDHRRAEQMNAVVRQTLKFYLEGK